MYIPKANYLKQQWNLVRRDSLFTNSTYFFANTLLVSGLGFVFWWCAARFFSDENVGNTVVIISTAQLVTTISILGSTFGLIRFLPSAKSQRAELINAVFTFVAGFTFILTLFIIFIGSWLFPALLILKEDPIFATIFLVFVVALALFQLTQPILASLRAGKALLLLSLITSLGRIILLVIFIKYPRPYAPALAFSIPTILSVIIIVSIILPKLIQHYQFRINVKITHWSHVIKYSLSSYVGNVLHDFPYQILPLIVAAQFGAAYAAYFFISWNIFSLLTTLGNSIGLSLFVEGSHKLSNFQRVATKSTISILIITTFASLFIVLFARPILFMFGADYADNGTALLRVTAIAAIPASIVYAKVAALRVKMRLRSVIVAFAIIAVISLPFTFYYSANTVVAVGVIWLLAQTISATYVSILD